MAAAPKAGTRLPQPMRAALKKTMTRSTSQKGTRSTPLRHMSSDATSIMTSAASTPSTTGTTVIEKMFPMTSE